MKKTNQKKLLEEVDTDPYSISILEELMNSEHEWTNTDEMVKLTFKAMTDILSVHGQSIKDIKSIITTRSSKTQVSAGLSLKANITDVSRTFEETSNALDSKVSFHDMTNILKDYANKTDINLILAENKTQFKSQRQDNTRPDRENLELDILKARMDEFQKEITRRLGSCVNLTEFQDVLNIVDHKPNINEINDALENKASKQYLTTLLQKKVNKSDFELSLSKKADTTDLDYIINSLESKVSLSTLQKLTQVIENKADKSDLIAFSNERTNHNRSQQRFLEEESHEKMDQIKAAIALDIKEVRKQLDQVSKMWIVEHDMIRKEFHGEIKKYTNFNQIENNKNLSKTKIELSEDIHILKAQFKNISQDIQSKQKNESILRDLTNQINTRKRCEEKIYEEIDDVRKRAEEVAGKSVEKKQFIDFRAELMQNMDEKVEVEDVQTALNKFQVEINQKLSHDKEEMLLLLNNVQRNLSEGISINANDLLELRKIITKKQDKNDYTLVEDNLRKARKEIEECRKTVDLVYCQLNCKINIKQYETDLVEIRKRFELMSKEVNLKANIKDVCVLSDSKPNIDDVNKALKQLNDGLQDKISEEDLQNILKDQATINETLCAENIVGRWMWQSGQLKAGNLIPWEIECANTVPDHFFWEKDKSSILIIAAGVYEIIGCVFNKQSTLSILVNGEQLVSGYKSEENMNAMNKKLQKKKNSKDVCGNKLHEYALLPARSRISLICLDGTGEAFLHVRRL